MRTFYEEKIFFALLFLAIFQMSVCGTARVNAELLLNTKFQDFTDTINPDNWEKTTNFDWQRCTTGGYDDLSCIRVNATPNAYMFQTTVVDTITEEDICVASVYILDGGAGGAFKLQLLFYNNDLSTIVGGPYDTSVATSGTWEQLTLNEVAPAGAERAQIRITSVTEDLLDNKIYVDEAHLDITVIAEFGVETGLILLSVGSITFTYIVFRRNKNSHRIKNLVY